MRPSRGWLLAGLAGLTAALVAGCGGDDEEPAPHPAIAESTTVTRTEATLPVGEGSGGVRLAKVGDFDAPLWVAQAPGSADLYVVEQGGRVKLVRDGEIAEEPFFDISDEVTSGGEQGLLSIAFDPDFERTRLLYAYYTDLEGDERVIELKANADGTAAEPDSRREILHTDDFEINHNGGSLVFGLDELLYIGTGDGGGGYDPQRNGQDLGSLLGKILRIDPHPSGNKAYGIPADNPFVDTPGARPEVYSYGLRNPWRFSFDPPTGSLFIGDVGQDRFEEIDYVTRAQGAGSGANFGWSAFEGNAVMNPDQSAPGHIRPVLVYGLDGTCSVTGGYVVRDPSLPSLYGRYLYGDFCAGELRSFVPSKGEARGDRELGLTVPQLSSFGVDAAGHIYATSLNGPVFRLVSE
jgi:glucose/arabinose dehydrogenase